MVSQITKQRDIKLFIDDVKKGNFNEVKKAMASKSYLNPNIRQYRFDYVSPLQYAIIYKHKNIIDFFLEFPIKWKGVDSDKFTLFHTAASYYVPEEILIKLLKQDIPKIHNILGMKDKVGNTPLEYYIYNSFNIRPLNLKLIELFGIKEGRVDTEDPSVY